MRSLFYLLVAISFWSMGPLFVKHFTSSYDAWTQNAFRYSSAAVMLMALALLHRRPVFRLTRAQWRKLLIVAAANIAMQTAFAWVYYFIYPSVASLVMRSDILFICILSFVFFHDERRVIRSGGFLFGAGLALLGLAIVVAAQDPEILARLEVSEKRFWQGIVMVVVYAFLLAVYTLTIKHAVRDVHPIASFTNVAWMSSVGLIALMFVFGRPADLWHAEIGSLLFMAFSALCCIVIAHTAIYAALREIKAVVTTTLMLLIPVITCATSAVVYRDRLSLVQMLGGLAVLTGAWFTAMAQVRVARQDTRIEAEMP